MHYTGMAAYGKNGKVIFEAHWADRGVWENVEIPNGEHVVGFHGYIHMDWQIIHLGLL
eukprot:CAMPEP_0170467294 /NCGR_PEP_ID=MMETSP0123-20130129/10923_1 /TAXON_ID=182087 /ORGANISM="Favella ehrenbergii, Strain Fehren 1" /LENGTH=57 /DNA_ID=CAMNT_0010733617 /DNA_START=588 /DNA_END=757 /DNA_ORIENTATION=-